MVWTFTNVQFLWPSQKTELYSELKKNLNKMKTNQDQFVDYSLKK